MKNTGDAVNDIFFIDVRNGFSFFLCLYIKMTSIYKWTNSQSAKYKELDKQECVNHVLLGQI